MTTLTELEAITWPGRPGARSSAPRSEAGPTLSRSLTRRRRMSSPTWPAPDVDTAVTAVDTAELALVSVECHAAPGSAVMVLRPCLRPDD